MCVVEILLLHVVEHTSGSTYYHLWREVAHGAVLVHGRTASVAGIGPGVAAQFGCHALRLDGKFSARHKYQHRRMWLGLHGLKDGKHIAQCLAAARGGKQDKGVVAANLGQHLLLHGIQGLNT